MNERMHARIRQVRSRASVLKWQARQAKYSHGVWYRLGRLLAEAEEMYALDDAAMDELLAEGFANTLPAQEIVPPKRIVFAPRERMAGFANRRRLPMRVGSEFLAARNVVLVRFE